MPQVQIPQIQIPPDAIPVVTVALGILLLLFGRSLYWAAIAAIGFLAGMALANQLLADKEQWIRIAVAIGAGLVGAIIGIALQRLAFAICGFFAGAYLAMHIAMHFQAGGDPKIWMLIGGVIGAIIAAMIMDWAIIVLTSLAGAVAVISPFQAKFDERVLGIAFVVIAAIGIVFQSRMMVAAPPPAAPPPTTV